MTVSAGNAIDAFSIFIGAARAAGAPSAATPTIAAAANALRSTFIADSPCWRWSLSSLTRWFASYRHIPGQRTGLHPLQRRIHRHHQHGYDHGSGNHAGGI